MNLLDALLPTLNRLTSNVGAQAVNITFTPALPPQVREQIAASLNNQPFTLTVSGTSGSQIVFTSPTGAQFTATVNPPLALGTQLQLSVADILPQNGAPALPTIQARILPPETPAATPLPGTIPSPAQPAQPAPTPILTLAPDSHITNQELRTLVTTTLLQQTVTALAQATQTPSTLPVPAGPVAATIPATLQNTLLGQILTLTPTAPMQPDGTQTATLQPAPAGGTAPATPPLRPETITLNLGVPLPVAKPQQAMLLPAPPTTPQAQPLPPVLFLIGQQATPALPVPPPPGLQVQQPQPAAEEPLPQPAAQPIRVPETSLPTTARILPATPDLPAGTQTALAANGTTIALTSPQPLPTGSIIVADFPINPAAGVQRVLPSDAEANPQTNTALGRPTQTAAPTAPQTPHAVLAPGMVMQGTITGQNEEGQPILTITQPGALSGATVPLTLAESTALLPIGAQISIRVENNLAATILGLTLPPQTQSAFTVNTLGTRWEGLQQALKVLQQQAPMQAANMRDAIPHLANMMPGLIAFTNALRTNRVEDIFDRETTQLLKSMGIDLSSDISQLSQLQQRPHQNADTQWRGTLFPYVEATGEDPRQGGFFWRREKADNPRAPTSTRFVVEVEMSQTGPMQLDGLVTYPEMWLKLRRTTAPEPGFTENLQRMVNSLLEASGLTGGIAVETTASFPVNPRADLLAHTENPLPTTA